MEYRIGSFNCQKFAYAQKKNVDIFAKIIEDEKFDIVALQEITRKEALLTILNALNHGGDKWRGAIDTKVNEYAFIWNKDRVGLAESPTANGNRRYDPRIYQQYHLDKSRGQIDLINEPFFARFVPTHKAPLFIEIRILNAHIRFGKHVSDESNAIMDLGQIRMRKNEFDVLTHTIYKKEADKRYGNNRPAYTIILGDYNLNMRSSQASSPFLEEEFIISETGMVDKRITTVQNELTTLKQNSDPAETTNGYSSNYDHFTYDAERFQGIGMNAQRVDSVGKYCKGDFEKHRKEVSDHVPIVLKMKIER